MPSSSRPTTPLERRRRKSHRSSGITVPTLSPKIHHYPIDKDHLPLESPDIISKFTSLSDSIDDLDINMRDLYQIHDALSGQTNESFASFLYGLSMTLWCVDFPGNPSKETYEESIRRKERKEKIKQIEQKIEEAESINLRLKQRLNEEKIKQPITKPVTKQITRPLRTTSQNIPNKRPKHNENDTGSENSFVAQPQNKSKIPFAKPTSRNSSGPNLNQPPRYMRGLFDKKQDQSSKPSSLANRPRFR
ncbi:unnamed protein product [Candida verbasci]|uniref:DASH complex subunit DAM1 n=1 Tax=Candida verbasci TaxID=1227364 RepID=A0A9W4XKT6_9ASCO|nr:unnamed protein product [Candida verbasci]